MDITKELLKMEDIEYKEFHSKLMPTVDKEKIIIRFSKETAVICGNCIAYCFRFNSRVFAVTACEYAKHTNNGSD